ncbi:MAG: lipoyl(octanoyl) transferase LipB [Chloroflexi bacterium]|nr:lipoyl(octanoyl) transferase LipB [Chloroflexota bacterium]
MKRMWLLNLGVEPYDAVHELQLKLVAWRQAGRIEDTLLLLEHEPVITLGRRGDEGHILASKETLAREGILVRRIERGGDVTYHGPGQLVGYPILYLPDYGLGVGDYMHHLERVIIETLCEFGLRPHRREGLIGVWMGANKIAALGVRIRRGVTFHGFALNVAPNMTHWATIIPCGIIDGGVTSLAAELGYAPPVADLRRRVAAQFARLFDVQIEEITMEALAALEEERSGTSLYGEAPGQGRPC